MNKCRERNDDGRLQANSLVASFALFCSFCWHPLRFRQHFEVSTEDELVHHCHSCWIHVDLLFQMSVRRSYCVTDTGYYLTVSLVRKKNECVMGTVLLPDFLLSFDFR